MYAFCFFVVLLCTPNIHCMFVHPGRGSLWLFLGGSSIFFPCYNGCCSGVFLTGIKGLRTEVVVDFTDEQPTEPMVL